MHSRDLILIRNYVGLARSSNYLAMCCSGNAAVAQTWRDCRGQYMAAARAIKDRSANNVD